MYLNIFAVFTIASDALSRALGGFADHSVSFYLGDQHRGTQGTYNVVDFGFFAQNLTTIRASPSSQALLWPFIPHYNAPVFEANYV